MRKFIISDVHGFGNFYYSVMSYLDNIRKNEEIELYINGDLFDRGYESIDILLDIKKRIQKDKQNIIYLGGNHELLMHEVFDKRRNGKRVSPFDDWFMNGGFVTDDGLNEKCKTKDEIFEIADFVSNLKIYHKFDERINNKNIVLIHAASLDKIDDVCNLKIKDNNEDVSYAVWTRESDIGKNKIGNNEFFTIIGHTPTSNPLGYDYYHDGNYLNIDGGCAAYAMGHFNYDHFPLVEVCSGYLKMLTFNSNNEIICANYFDGKKIFSYTTKEIENARSYLDKNVKIKKLSLDEYGTVIYKK